MLVEQIDAISLQALKHSIRCGLDLRGSAVHSAAALSRLQVDIPAEFRGDDHLVADRCQGLTHKILIREWAINFGGVEKRDSTLSSGPNDLDAFLPVGRWTVAVA